MNWIDLKDYNDQSGGEIYTTAVYFCITTITTVGYGDITGNTTGERIFCILLMLLGVIAFSFATGSLSSILSQYDSAQKKFKQDMKLLDQLKGAH